MVLSDDILKADGLDVEGEGPSNADLVQLERDFTRGETAKYKKKTHSQISSCIVLTYFIYQ